MNTELTMVDVRNHPFNWYRRRGEKFYHAHRSRWDMSNEGSNEISLCGRRWRGQSWDNAYSGADAIDLPTCEECARIGLMMELAE